MSLLVVIIGLVSLTTWTYGTFLAGKYILINKKAPMYDKVTVVIGFVMAVLFFIGSNN